MLYKDENFNGCIDFSIAKIFPLRSSGVFANISQCKKKIQSLFELSSAKLTNASQMNIREPKTPDLVRNFDSWNSGRCTYVPVTAWIESVMTWTPVSPTSMMFTVSISLLAIQSNCSRIAVVICSECRRNVFVRKIVAIKHIVEYLRSYNFCDLASAFVSYDIKNKWAHY